MIVWKTGAYNRFNTRHKRNALHVTGALLIVLFDFACAIAQPTVQPKEVFYHQQSWTSINSVMRFSTHWGLMADLHVRKDNFMSNDYFYLVRLGAVTWLKGRYPVAFGIAHMWLAPWAGNRIWVDENRIYQQWSAGQRAGRVALFHRIRLEQRWRELVVNNTKSGERQFSVRLRYLNSFETKFFKNKRLPSLVLSDELLVQFGHEVLNAFDQNRFFIGVKIPIAKNLSCDTGYMNVWQQRANGYQYDSSDVFRFFLYYNLDFRKDKDVTEYFENTE